MVELSLRSRRRLRRRLWHGANATALRASRAQLRIRSAELAAVSGFFRECPSQELDSSIAELTSLVPSVARLSRGARRLLPAVLAWLGGFERLPLGVAGVFSDQDMRPVSLKTRLRHQRCQEAVTAVRLLALSRFLLCEKLQEVVERWIFRSGAMARRAVALQLLEGESKEGLGLGDLSLGPAARRSLAEGLSTLQRPSLRHVATEASQWLKDEQHKVRQSMLRALRVAGPAAALPCAEAMVLCLEDENPEVRSEAARSLCQLSAEGGGSFSAARTAKLVAPLISQQNQRVIDHATEGLVALGEVVTPVVLPYLIHGHKTARQAAVEVFRRVGKAGLHQAAELLSHESCDVRRAALRIFQGSTCEEMQCTVRIQDIGHLLQDSDSRVRGVAALALCRWGSRAARPFAADLIWILQSGDGAELRDVLSALGSLGSSAAWAAEAVAQCLWLEQWSVRRAAAETYGQILGPRPWVGQDDSDEALEDAMVPSKAPVDREAAALQLSKLLKDHVVDVAESAAKALGRMGLDGARMALQLAQCLEDDHDLARAALDALVKLLSSECFATKEAAAAGVAMYFNRGGQASKTARSHLMERLLREARCEDRNVREECIRALGYLAEERSVQRVLKEVIHAALEDVQMSVKRCAIQVLGRLNLPPEAHDQRESVLKMLAKSPWRQLQRCALQAFHHM